MNKYLKYGIMGVISVALSGILFTSRYKKEVTHPLRSYEDILHSGVLRAVTEYNSISFYVTEDTSTDSTTPCSKPLPRIKD